MTQPKAKAKRKVHTPRTKTKLDAAQELAGQMAAYQEDMQQKMAEYDTLIKNAQAELTAMVKTVNEPVAPPQPKAEAQWTEAGGARFLVLNEQAAEQINSIFDVVGALAEQLKKL
jgi:roadblock/LC7 domain-containing protein